MTQRPEYSVSLYYKIKFWPKNQASYDLEWTVKVKVNVQDNTCIIKDFNAIDIDTAAWEIPETKYETGGNAIIAGKLVNSLYQTDSVT